MRLLPSGTRAVLVELDSQAEVLGLYAALRRDPPAGVVDLVPAARTVLVHVDPALSPLPAVVEALRATTPQQHTGDTGDLVEIPVHYDGEDLAEVGRLTGWGAQEVVRRHTGAGWTVAFCGFSPGFGYLVADGGGWDVPRRDTPRTRVPAGSVALAGEFSGVYPRASPGGWQLLGRTELRTFDVERDPPALLVPGTRVRFVDAGAS